MIDHHSAIERLVLECARRIDTGDLVGVAALFERGTLRTVDGDEVVTHTGPAEVRSFLESAVLLHEDGTPSTKHLVTNMVVDVDHGEVTAGASSYFTVLQARPELPLQVIAAGRYEDRFERVRAQWSFTDRLIRTDLAGDLSRHLATDPSRPRQP